MIKRNVQEQVSQLKILIYFGYTLFAIVAVLLLSCGNKRSYAADFEETVPSIMVYAAASLSDVIKEISDSFELNYGVKVKTNMASSGTLARQIEQGELPDVYISASEKWADYVQEVENISAQGKIIVARNELALIAPKNSDLQTIITDSAFLFNKPPDDGRLSMGHPSHVPVGMYAKESLSYFGLYDDLKDLILPAKDARSALMVVEMEEAPLGIVYRTDAEKSDKVKILTVFPEMSHSPIVYVALACNKGKHSNDFFTYLNSTQTMGIWLKYGFKK